MNIFDRDSGLLGGMGPLVFTVVALAIGVGMFSLSNKSPSKLLASGDAEGFKRLVEKYPSIATDKPKGGTLLMQAVKADCLGALPCLIKAGADVNEVNPAGYSVLSYALNNPDMVILLIQSGADVRHIHKDGSSLMHLAVQLGNPFSVYALALAGAPLNGLDSSGRAPIHLARGKNVSVLKSLLQRGANPDVRDLVGATALHGAAERDDYAAALALVNGGADLSVFSLQGWSPLHLSAIHDSVDVMCLLLESGIDVDLANEKGVTPLMCAIRKDNDNAIRALAGFGADLSRKGSFGNTPLHDALMQHKYDVAAILVESGAPLEVENDAGMTARELVLSAGDQHLLETLADLLRTSGGNLSAAK